MPLTQQSQVFHRIFYRESMLGCITVYQKINTLKSAQIGIRLRSREPESIGKRPYTTVYIRYNVMRQIHIQKIFIGQS